MSFINIDSSFSNFFIEGPSYDIGCFVSINSTILFCKSFLDSCKLVSFFSNSIILS